MFGRRLVRNRQSHKIEEEGLTNRIDGSPADACRGSRMRATELRRASSVGPAVTANDSTQTRFSHFAWHPNWPKNFYLPSCGCGASKTRGGVAVHFFLNDGPVKQASICFGSAVKLEGKLEPSGSSPSTPLRDIGHPLGLIAVLEHR
jgi:hypothetical protein